MTQRQLADLGHSTQQNISRYEKGFIPDSWFLLARLHTEKAIDLNWLLGVPAAATAEEPPGFSDRGVAAMAAPALDYATVSSGSDFAGAERNFTAPAGSFGASSDAFAARRDEFTPSTDGYTAPAQPSEQHS